MRSWWAGLSVLTSGVVLLTCEGVEMCGARGLVCQC